MADLTTWLPMLDEGATVVGTLEVELDPERVYRAQGVQAGRVSAAVKAATDALLPEAQGLLEPAFCCRVLTVTQPQLKQVQFAEGFTFHGRLPSRLFGTGSYVFAAACTVGQAVDRRIAELTEAGEIVDAFIMTAAASVGVAAVKARLNGLARAWAGRRQFRTGPAIAPSSRAWPLADQQVFAEMFPLDRIGLELTEALMLRPTKSSTMALAIGDQVEEGDSCDYCAIRKTCQFRGLQVTHQG